MCLSVCMSVAELRVSQVVGKGCRRIECFEQQKESTAVKCLHWKKQCCIKDYSKYQLHLVEGDRDHYVLLGIPEPILASGLSLEPYKLLVYVKQSCTD